MKRVKKQPKLEEEFMAASHFNKAPGEFISYLCEECKRLGYCKSRHEKAEAEARIKNVIRFNIKDYLKQVPLQIEDSYYDPFSKFHLQEACDAFHQADYETAILNFRAVTSVMGSFSIAIIGAALSYFMLKDYDTTLMLIERYETSFYWSDVMMYTLIAEIEKRKSEINNQEKIAAETLSTKKTLKPKVYVLQNS